MQTLLTEVVNLRDTRCDGRKNLVHAQCATLYPDSKETRTSAIQRPVRPVLVSQLWGLGLAGFLLTRRSMFVRVCSYDRAMSRTNLMATGWLFNMFVPARRGPSVAPGPLFTLPM